jgi:hypothetical protein
VPALVSKSVNTIITGFVCLTPCIIRQLTAEKVTNKCIVIVPSRDAHTTTQSSVKQQNIFNILFIILTHGKLKLKNNNVNNYILENIHIVLPLYHITSTLMMAME